jgi:AraC family L-rhamnose operon regulatory protein RhaS
VRRGKIHFQGVGRGHYPGDRLKKDELPGLLSLGYWDARGEQDWGMDFHRNEGVEFCFLETGSMQFSVDGESHPLNPGCLTITRPWQLHRQGSPCIAAGRLHWATLATRAQRPDQPWQWPSWVLLSKEDREELARRIRMTDKAVWCASPDIVHCFSRVRQALKSTTGARRMSILAVGLNELLLGILEMLQAENRPEQANLATNEHSVDLFLRDLRSNPNSLERNWTLKSMAAACGIGTTLFSRLCRRLTNDSPLRYLNLARLDTAARLLRAKGSRSITDIAFDCGFQSSQYFAHQFRRRFKKTPSAYRNQPKP